MRADKFEVVLDGVEYELSGDMSSLRSVEQLAGSRIITPKPQKSELDKMSKCIVLTHSNGTDVLIRCKDIARASRYEMLLNEHYVEVDFYESTGLEKERFAFKNKEDADIIFRTIKTIIENCDE